MSFVIWTLSNDFDCVFSVVQHVTQQPALVQAAQQANTKVVIPFPEEAENVTRWIVDQNFRKEQERLKIPFGEFDRI